MLESGHIVTINILVSGTGMETYVLLWKRFFRVKESYTPAFYACK
jgi:hypothetical protein